MESVSQESGILLALQAIKPPRAINLYRAAKVYNVPYTDDLPDDVYSAKGDLDEMHERFKNWDPVFRNMLRMVEETSVWRLQNSIEMESLAVQFPFGPNVHSALLVHDICSASPLVLPVGSLPLRMQVSHVFVFSI